MIVVLVVTIHYEGLFRLQPAIEALIGLVLITWTASFLYLETTRYWPSRSP